MVYNQYQDFFMYILINYINNLYIIMSRHGNETRIRGARPRPVLILTEKIWVDRGRGQVFRDS